jgi:preprotein translocase subunit Sec63
VARAYKTLTDPAAKENFEKYGNPDGKQSLAVSAACSLLWCGVLSSTIFCLRRHMVACHA